MHIPFPPKLHWFGRKMSFAYSLGGPWLKCDGSAPILLAGGARPSVSLADLQGLCASIGNPRHRPVLSFNRVPYSSSPIPTYHRPQRCDMTLNTFASLSKNAEPYTRGRRSALYHLLLPSRHWIYHSRLSLTSHSSTPFSPNTIFTNRKTEPV